MITDPKLFYRNFQVNYYDYIQLSLKQLLDNSNENKLKNNIIEYNTKDYERAIKSSIRQTYFHAIETVFELVFALCPDKKNSINEVEIMRTITKSDLPYKRIQDIAKDKQNLDFLDLQLNAGYNSHFRSLHLFYWNS